MPEAGWLLLLLFLGICSLIVVAILWPIYPHGRLLHIVASSKKRGMDEAQKGSTAPVQATLSVSALLEMVNNRPDDAPHVLIIGPSGTGKTTLAQAIAATRSGSLVILDPKWQPGKWGSLPATAIDDDGRYTQLETMLRSLLTELTARLVSLKQGVTEFPELTIITEEFPTLITECPSAAELFKQVGRLGRELRMRLVGLSQSERVKSLGIAGEGDTKDNYTFIRLGKAAIDVLPESRTQTRPAILEWKGAHYLLTLDNILQLSTRSIPNSRSWAPDSGETVLQKQGLKHISAHTSQHTTVETITNNTTEIHFSIDEIGVIVLLILQGIEKNTAIRSMPRYNRKRHKAYITYYEQLKAAIGRTATTDNP